MLNQLDFKLETHSTFAYLQEHKNATNLGELINTALSCLENKDIIGDAYEYLIAKFTSDSGKKGGEFYTLVW